MVDIRKKLLFNMKIAGARPNIRFLVDREYGLVYTEQSGLNGILHQNDHDYYLYNHPTVHCGFYLSSDDQITCFPNREIEIVLLDLYQLESD